MAFSVRFAGYTFHGYDGYHSLEIVVSRRHYASLDTLLPCASRWENIQDADPNGFTDIVLAHSRLAYECRSALRLMFKASSVSI